MRLIWRLINKHRKAKSSSVCKLVKNETVTNDPEEISKIFANHFSNLYIPKDHAHFDNDFKLEIENKVKTFSPTKRRMLS